MCSLNLQYSIALNEQLHPGAEGGARGSYWFISPTANCIQVKLKAYSRRIEVSTINTVHTI